MRKTFLILSVLVIFNSSQAQQTNIPIRKPALVLPDTVLLLKPIPNDNRKKYTVDNMPNPLKGVGNQLTKMGSTIRSFDLYQSNLDNMFVLKPDKQNLAANYIPNGLKTLPDFLHKPDLMGNDKINVLIDSLMRSK